MSSVKAAPATACHVVVIAYPGRGNINPMLNLCKILASKKTEILVTFVATEEWLGFIGSDTKLENVRFASIPNVVPSELVRAANMDTFVEAVLTKMEAPFERLLDRLDPPPAVIVSDTFLSWTVGVGNRRNIPVASFWTSSASAFSVVQHFDLLVQNKHFPVDISAKGNERVNYIPGISSTRVVDLPLIDGKQEKMLQSFQKLIPWVTKAQYFLFPSTYELESEAIDVLKAEFPFPVYAIGPSIPYFELGENFSLASGDSDLNYFEWLDCQPRNSVLYISMGSFLSISSAQMDELAAGLRDSGVRFLWVARGESCRVKEICGDMGFVVAWCEQLRVLSHSSIGGFLTHCGWNSTQEGVYCGVPFLTLPIVNDQPLNSKLIVEDWKIGWRVKQEVGVDKLVTREEIARVVKNFMNLESDKGKEMRRRASELQQITQRAIAEKGSSQNNINAFVTDIFHNANEAR
ncbi:UDP-glycosyltransferase 87A1-like [Corylus avellana]|uniref:UDP-glycosyltransferase 87A1-like n=1 Tax=Corylus avellana TaxID=13451 RepID=UPI001E1EC1D0|nr:UDP-glycosyltransferase 87A1-like [Corylus avellana]XP_059451596.1 UDP-glycosyltransferase 87A1-like [Corylus avellana]